MNRTVTAIVPTFRRPLLLRRAIESVLGQSYPHVRVCVYDNASGDETADVVAQIAARDPRVAYHCHPENVGAFANFAHGLGAVDTEYFSFLSDDDVLLPGFYAQAVAALEPRPDAAFWGGQGIVMRDDGTIKDATDWPAAAWLPPDGVLAMITNNYLIWTSVLFRTRQVAGLGGLDPEVGAAIDTDFLLRVAAERPYLTASVPAAIWMSHSESSTVLANLSFIWPGWLKVMHNISGNERIAAPVRQEVGRLLTEHLKRQLFQIGYNALRQGKPAEARQVAAILGGTYDQADRARLLSAAAAAVAVFPPARHLVTLAERARRLRPNKAQARAERFQRELGQYARHIELR